MTVCKIMWIFDNCRRVESFDDVGCRTGFRGHGTGTGAEATGASPPSLAGAVTQPPDWIGNSAPFDVAAYFAAPAPVENAAPLYLDALFEFGSSVATCFPEGPRREERKAAVNERWNRYSKIRLALSQDPKRVSSETIDDLIRDTTTAFANWHERRSVRDASSKQGWGCRRHFLTLMPFPDTAVSPS